MLKYRYKNKYPIIFSIPHSGSNYSSKFLKLTSLDMNELRRSEDIYIDELFNKSINCGFSYVQALFPRIYIDVNRHPLEIDSSMFSTKILIDKSIDRSKINNGIGLIPKYSVYGNEIYFNSLSKSELRYRLLNYYFPYHKILKSYISKIIHDHNNILLFDCHSMPSNSIDNYDTDIVLGNNMGNSVSKNLFNEIKQIFINLKFKVSINKPYSGGFITKYYSKPENGIHVLQFELNRKKYIDEKSLNKNLNNMQCISHKLSIAILEINKLLNNVN